MNQQPIVIQTMSNTDNLLRQFYACSYARDWAKGKSFQEIYDTCHRGDWLCWLFNKTNPEDLRLLTLVKGHQANTVRHLVRDDRSRNAIDIAIKFGNGEAERDELNTAAAAAYAAADDAAAYVAAAADAAAAYAAAYAAAADDAAAAAAAAAYAAAADAAAADDDARNKSLLNSANIFRKYISIDKFNI